MTPEAPPRPHYRHWSEVPEHLLTRTALGREGFLPGGPERATITYNRSKDETVLFDWREATPKRPLTEVQLLGFELGARFEHDYPSPAMRECGQPARDALNALDGTTL